MRGLLRVLQELWTVAVECTDSERLDREILDRVLPFWGAEKGIIGGLGKAPSGSGFRGLDSVLVEGATAATWELVNENSHFCRHALLYGVAVDTLLFSRKELDASAFVRRYLKPQGIQSTAFLLWPNLRDGLSYLAICRTSGVITEDREIELRVLSRYLAIIRSSFVDDSLQAAAAFVSGLTDHQQLIVAMVSEGRTNKEIAAQLGISPNTVRNHLVQLFEDAHVTSRAQLAAKGKLGSCVSSMYRHRQEKVHDYWEALLIR